MRWFYAGLLLWGLTTVNAQQRTAGKTPEADSLFNTGKRWINTNKDSAYRYFEDTYRRYKKHSDWSGCMETLVFINYTSGSHFDLAKYQRSIRSVDSLLEERRVYFDSIDEYRKLKNYVLINKTAYYSDIKNYKKVREYAVALRQLIEALPDSLRAKERERLERVYNYEAQSYEGEGKYKMAQDLYEKSLRLSLERGDEASARSVYRLLGSLYRKQQQYENSNHYLKKGLAGETGERVTSRNSIVTSCYAIAGNYIQLKKTDSAMHYLTGAHQQLTADDPLEYQYYQRLGEVNAATGKYDEALTALDKALELITASELKRVERARLYSTKARVYEDMNRHREALENYRYALQSLSKDFSPENPAENPSPESIDNNIEYLTILKDKATALNKARNFDAALQTTTLAVRLLDSLKPEFHNEEDKQLLIENSYALFEAGLAAVLQGNTETRKAGLVDRAFFFMEKSKSAVLLEAILSAYAYDFAGIPQTLLEKELQLKAHISRYQKEVDRKKSDEVWKDRLFEARKQHRELIREFETGYPAYYDLKYNTRVIDVETLQQMLDPHTLFLSYFYGKEAMYAVAVSGTTKELVKIPLNNDLETQIRHLYNMLIDPASEPEKLITISKALYQRLLHPLIKNTSYTRLVVLPDGLLNYIPFEILHDGTQYITARMAVSYAPSATLLRQLQQKNPDNIRVLAFAPDFSALPGDHLPLLQPLPNAEKEAQEVLSYFKGRLYKAENATLKNFNTESASYGIYHLATHAVINDETPEYSYLAFTPVKNEEYLLYLNDIYAMKLNAAMVALSACETGIGDLRKGEGMMSLSRAFFYAGAASITNTKWDVNDYSVSQIMKSFYNYLSEGKKKDEALRLAKADFLKKNGDNRLNHPYYWAGIVITGNTAAVETSSPLWIGLLPLLALVLFTIWLLRKRKKKRYANS